MPAKKTMTAETREILEALHQEFKVPINVEQIVRSESNIRLRPGDYGDRFDGRIEYLPQHRVFFLYHAKGITPRVRFSICHELGHFYIPEHRELLLTGKFHNSEAGYLSDRRLEREADEFAASLLIPDDYLHRLTAKRKFLTLQDLLELANDLQVSATAMVIRYVRTTSDRCAAILWRDGQQKFYLASEEMECMGFQWRGRKDVPRESAAAEAIKNPGCGKVFQRASDSGMWFSSRCNECEIWEESFPLGYTGLVLTLLADSSYEG